MESVINKLSEIEIAASRILDGADNQKKLLDEQQEERIAAFDAELEAKTSNQIARITEELRLKTDAEQKKLQTSASELLSSLDSYYETHHGTLSTEIYEKIIRK